MNRPAVFFDRDNTLIIGNDYLGDPEKVVLINGAAETVARARSLGYATVVVSNQSGVARGMFGEQDVQAVNQRMNQMLLAENPEAVIDQHEFCPYHPQAPVAQYRVESDSRKPKPGMLLKAAKDLGLDLERSWMIGDAARDIEAGHAAGCRTILFTDKSLPASPAALAVPKVKPDFVAGSLKEAMDYIAASNDDPTPLLPLPPMPETPEPTPVSAAVDASAEAKEPVDSAHPPITDENATPAQTPLPTVLPTTGTVTMPSNGTRLEQLAERILDELRRSREQTHMDFSVSKLLAGIVQVIAVALAFLAYLDRNSENLQSLLLAAIFFQAMVSSLLIMGRQKDR